VTSLYFAGAADTARVANWKLLLYELGGYFFEYARHELSEEGHFVWNAEDTGHLERELARERTTRRRGWCAWRALRTGVPGLEDVVWPVRERGAKQTWKEDSRGGEGGAKQSRNEGADGGGQEEVKGVGDDGSKLVVEEEEAREAEEKSMESMVRSVELLLQVSKVDLVVVPCANDAAVLQHCNAIVQFLLTSYTSSSPRGGWGRESRGDSGGRAGRRTPSLENTFYGAHSDQMRNGLVKRAVVVEVGAGENLQTLLRMGPHYACSAKNTVPSSTSENTFSTEHLLQNSVPSGLHILVWAGGCDEMQVALRRAVGYREGCHQLLAVDECGARDEDFRVEREGEELPGEWSRQPGTADFRNNPQPNSQPHPQPGFPQSTTHGRGGAAASGDDGRGVGTRVLHLSFHLGLRREVEAIACLLNITIDYEDFPAAGRDSNFKYNLDREHATRIWRAHGERWRQNYDVVITSDTAPISRVFLEERRWVGKRLIVWICNRFDYHHAPAEHGFPDPDFYDLMRQAGNGSMGGAVRLVANTEFERRYAAVKGVGISEAVVTPIGLASSDVCRAPAPSYISAPGEAVRSAGLALELGGGFKEATDIPIVDPSEMMFLPARGNEVYMEGMCLFLGISCNTKVGSLAEWTTRLALTRNNGFPNLYRDARELTRYKAVLHVPYSWSTLAFWEFLQAGLVVVVPTARFFMQLIYNCEAWGAWLCDALQTMYGGTWNTGMGTYVDILWFQDFAHVTSEDDLHAAEWWAPQNSEMLVYFDSWDDLRQIARVRSLDWERHRAKVRAIMRQRIVSTARQWRRLLRSAEEEEEEEERIGADGPHSAGDEAREHFEQHAWLFNVHSLHNYTKNCCLFGGQLLTHLSGAVIAHRLSRGWVEPHFIHQQRNSSLAESQIDAGKATLGQDSHILGQIVVGCTRLFRCDRSVFAPYIDKYLSLEQLLTHSGGVIDHLLVQNAEVISRQVHMRACVRRLGCACCTRTRTDVNTYVYACCEYISICMHTGLRRRAKLLQPQLPTGAAGHGRPAAHGVLRTTLLCEKGVVLPTRHWFLSLVRHGRRGVGAGQGRRRCQSHHRTRSDPQHGVHAQCGAGNGTPAALSRGSDLDGGV